MIKAALALQIGIASDAGLQRARNEDRVYVNEGSGVFLVVDGMGGHAAGEQAANTAVSIVSAEIETRKGSVETRIRRAIAAANNAIFEQARSRPEWSGMACVLALAVVHEDKLYVGHVGDSRLYLAWAGSLRKLTRDHSPVGEREDRGDLTEEEAMRDPLRNVVFRDVGSRLHDPGDEDFIEMRSVPFRPDAAFLLCTDGLSDVLTTAEIAEIVQQYDGDPQRVSEQLVEAANRGGGKDNVSAIFVAGPEFRGSQSRAMAEARSRHAVTRLRHKNWLRRSAFALLWFAAGIVAGAAGWVQLERFLGASPAQAPARSISIDASNPQSLRNTLRSAMPGQSILLASGDYSGPIQLREGVTISGAGPGLSSTIHGPVVATGLAGVRLEGLRIAADSGNGLIVRNSKLDAVADEFTGAQGCAIHAEGTSQVHLAANSIHGNACGVLAEGATSLQLDGNRFFANETAVELRGPAQLTFAGNIFGVNGKLLAGDISPAIQDAFARHNVLTGATGKTP